ncbi:hypothetical protein FRB97_001835 [Tulasnella sp. 331]|nr:hypothetical protein FRB97_001835 [Tulasnella sp. 331]
MAATAERMSIGLPLCDGFWRADKSNTDVAEQVIAAIQVLKPDSTRQCDHAFLKIIATLLAELTKSSTHWNSFDKSTSRIDLLRAVVFLTKVKEPGGLRNDAIKIMDILAKRPNLRYLEMQEYHLVADTIIAQISSNPLADLRRSTSIDLLKTTSDFALRIAPGSTQYQSFHPYRAQWLRSITYLATEKAEGIVPEIPREKEDDVSRYQSWARVVLRTVMELPEMAHFWNPDIVYRVLASYESLLSDSKKESSLAVGELMLPLLETPSCQSLTMDRGLLREHPAAARALVDWMKSSIQVLWVEALVIIDHWKEGWLCHDEEDIHSIFLNAGLATAVVAPWKQGTGVIVDVYSKRNGILEILAPKPAWRDALVAAFVEVAVKDKSWGDWKQVYRSMERWMIWRMVAIIPKQLQPRPESNPVFFAVNLMGMGTEELEEDRGWFRSYPEIAGLLCFALQQPPLISDTAFETIENKAEVWFDHKEMDLHRIFIDQGMAPALVSYLYLESEIGPESGRRDRILRMLLRSKDWFDAFYRSAVPNQNESGGDSENTNNNTLDIGLRARSILDLHRLLMESSSHAGSDIQASVLTSDEALRIVIGYVERRKSDLQEVELASCWSYAMTTYECRSLSSGLASHGGETERTKITL